ncbi:competence protein ComA [Desulfosporosinus sp. FKA]|uniref:competence protein ComA n=1 Tax=Desulfosporosinus sp. FKA TaxID=1969834 RepID=UPI000B4A3D07|nr:competence protein ComA [Desulfosporosinus sp. FKA]
MRKKLVVFEITDNELRVFKASLPLVAKLKQSYSSAAVKFDRIQIKGLIEQGIVRDKAALLGCLMDYQRESPCDGHLAFLAMPMQTGFVRSYKLPWLARSYRDSAIALLVAEEVPSSADLLYDYVILGEEKHKSLTILLGASRREVLEQFAAIFKQAGLRVSGINFSWAVIGQGLELNPDEDTLYVREETDGFHFALFRGLIPERVRTLFVQETNVALGDAEICSQDIRGYSKEWENEIQSFLLYLKAQNPDLSLKCLLWSGGLPLESLVKRVTLPDHITVAQAEFKSVPDSWLWALGENRGLAEAAMAYGLVLLKKSASLNLWRQPSKAGKMLKRYQIIGAALLSFLLLGNGSWVFLRQETSALKNEVQQLLHQGSELETQLRQQKDLTRSWKMTQARSEKVADILGQVQNLLDSQLTIKKLVYRQGTLSLTGSAGDVKSIQALIQGLRKLGWYRPVLTGYSSTSSEQIEFSISAKRKDVNN